MQKLEMLYFIREDQDYHAEITQYSKAKETYLDVNVIVDK